MDRIGEDYYSVLLYLYIAIFILLLSFIAFNFIYVLTIIKMNDDNSVLKTILLLNILVLELIYFFYIEKLINDGV